MFRIHINDYRDRPGVGPVVRRVTGRPPWVWLIALAVGLAPFAIAIALLALAALCVTAVVFTLLSAVDEVLGIIAGVFTGRRDGAGRRNVRVVRTDETG